MSDRLHPPTDAFEAVARARKHVQAAVDARTAMRPSLYPLATARLLEAVADALGGLAAELAAHGSTPLALEGAERLCGVLAEVRQRVPAGTALSLRFALDALAELKVPA